MNPKTANLSVQSRISNQHYSRLFKLFLSIIVLGLTLFPILRMIFILATTGANNPSVDDVAFFQIIDRALSGTYPWKNFIQDVFGNGHLNAFPILMEIAVNYFFHGNIYATLFLGLSFTVLQLALLYGAFTHFVKNNFRWLLLPILSAILFSTSQISTFEFDLPSMQNGLCRLGVILGIWGMVKFSGRWVGIGLMILGGIIACGSNGSGPIVWPTFLMGMVILRYRRASHYLIWFFATLVSSSPYIYFLILKRTPGQEVLILSLAGSLFNYKSFIRGVGWPFSQNFSIDAAYLRGLLGILFLVSGLFLVFQKKTKIKLIQFSPGIMLITFAALCIWQISIFRGGLAPWYTSIFILFWVGLVDLAYILWSNRNTQGIQKTASFQNLDPSILIWCVSFAILLAYYYATSNLSYVDKSFFLKSRSPASSSCLRNFKTAPTYCESTLFLWEPGKYFWLMPTLAEPLESHRLSVFSLEQRWTLQGDFILPNVQVHQRPGVQGMNWSKDLTINQAIFLDYHHLNLFLPSPNFVDWTLTLPKNLKKADFKSAIALSESTPHDKVSDGLIAEVIIMESGKEDRKVFSQYMEPNQSHWIPFEVPLDPFAGQTITLRLGSNGRQNNIHDWLMYRFPHIDLALNNEDGTATKEEMKPSNTDLSSLMPKTTDKDFIFDLRSENLWSKGGMTETSREVDGNITWKIQENPRIDFSEESPICLADFSHFYFKMSASSDISPRAVQILFQINGQPGYQRQIYIPLLDDEKMHEYTYDLKLLELRSSSKLTQIRFIPVAKGSKQGPSLVTVSDLRLIRKPEPSACLN